MQYNHIIISPVQETACQQNVKGQSLVELQQIFPQCVLGVIVTPASKPGK